MIISHKFKYVFVELPRTGSTAISAELRELYDGQSILQKHSHYSSFLQVATSEEKRYKVVSGIRNPLDDAVSLYEKYRTKTAYANAESIFDRRRYNFIRAKNADFATYLRKFYRLPYDNWTSAHHKHFDLVIRFEHLQQDFSRFLDIVGAKQMRPLPVLNKTARSLGFDEYYSQDAIKHAVSIFGPYMKKWGYRFPDHWNVQRIPMSSELMFRVLSAVRKNYWTHVRQPGAKYRFIYERLFTRTGS